jgi:D-alanyl-D-alanine carboxypeptidase
MLGHTTQLGPHEYNNAPQKSSGKAQAFKSRAREDLQKAGRFFKNKEHLLILIALFSFSLNMVLAYERFSPAPAPVAQVSESEISEEKQLLGSDDEDYEVMEDDTEAVMITDNIHYRINNGGSSPRVGAQAYLIGDIETGEIISSKNPDARYPMASVTKLMTAVVTKENVNLRHMATVSRASYNTYGVQGQLDVGEKILVSDLLYPLLIESSNDAAEVIADDYGRGAFMRLMNKKAEELGMTSTFFEDPSGLSPNNRTTVKDLLKLALYIERNHPDIYDMTRVRQYEILRHKWVNANQLLNKNNFMGGKNGYIDEARRTTVSLFEMPFVVRDANGKRRTESRTMVIVLLRSEDRTQDVNTLLNYIRSRVTYVE